MEISSRALVELVLLGPPGNRRQLQDSAILGDVWVAFAAEPDKPMDLLIKPFKNQPAGPVAKEIADRIAPLGLHGREEPANIAYLEGFIAARLFFRELLRVVIPMTKWLGHNIPEGQYSDAYTENELRTKIEAIINWAQAPDSKTQAKLGEAFFKFSAWDQFATLAGLILWAADQRGKGITPEQMPKKEDLGAIAETIEQLVSQIKQDHFQDEPQVWQVSLNRKVMPAVEKSVLSVKGDAARLLFNVRCNEITWAVLDSGIDSEHPVFQGKDEDGHENSRIVKIFDFSKIRKIVSLDNVNMGPMDFRQRFGDLLEGLKHNLSEDDAIKLLQALAKDAGNDRPIDWEQVEKLVEIKPTVPQFGHGTHVAGIIGAKSVVTKTMENPAGAADDVKSGARKFADGMCPDIKLYDFRVLSNTEADTEFAIIAALQYIRYSNERHAFISIHGVNLSLSIPHDVRNFACGRTPVCDECERLVESGVVVVAAAGNFGYQSYETQGGSYEGYTAFSITDPGNADDVITVGSTHRFEPQTYGVSFFSSRGPTGDGRMKPDLVAPGERIQSSLPNEDWGELDGGRAWRRRM